MLFLYLGFFHHVSAKAAGPIQAVIARPVFFRVFDVEAPGFRSPAAGGAPNLIFHELLLKQRSNLMGPVAKERGDPHANE